MLSMVDARRWERLTRRIEELRAWRNAREFAITDWQFDAGDGQPRSVRPGDFWPVIQTPVRLRAKTTVPPDWAGQPVELELWLGGEGLIRLSTGLQAGLDPFHHSFPIANLADGGESLEIDAEVVPKGMFGSHVADPRIERAHLVVPHREVRGLERDLAMVLEASQQLGEHEIVPILLEAVDAAVARLGPDWPSASDVVVTRLVRGYVDTIGSGIRSVPAGYGPEAVDVHPFSAPLWQTPAAPRPLEPLPAAAVAAVGAARTEVANRLAELKQQFPPVGRLAMTGHAHIDLAWLWPLAETRRKARRTFSSVAMLMDRYDDFTFNQSSPAAYAWIEEDDPALFTRIKERVAEGRWEPVGGSWAEPDCNITGGEAFVRQLLYGQRYWQSRFGRRATVAWLPDVFGFSAGIPQLLRGAGISSFFTIKLTWNETNTFPYDLFEWEGIDGSRVTAHMFRNLSPAHGYNGNIAPLDTLGTWRQFGGKYRHPESLFAFGWGDGGGGPSQKMLENYARIKEFPALPRLRMARVDEFFASLPNEGLPRWVGELYLELHRGTLTSQAKIKALNRAAEHRLLEAEAFGTIAGLDGFPYPGAELESAWKTVLLNQFHDILPGSSINEVYQDTHREMMGVVETATQTRDAALRHVSGAADGPAAANRVLVANAGLVPRPLTVVLPSGAGAMVTTADGASVPTQETTDGMLVHDPRRAVPGLGWLRLTVGERGEAAAPRTTVRAEIADDGAVVENDLIRVEVGSDGTLHRIVDKVATRDVLAGRGNQLWLYVDKPRNWDAWDIDEAYEREGEELLQPELMEIDEAGPLRAAVRVERVWRGSRIVQTYRLLAGAQRLDIETRIDWHERNVLIKARFPLAVHTHEATYETMYGAIRRPTHRNTSWDAARFEVAGQRFADLSEPGYGVALLNDGKYGHDASGNVLSLSLLRSPLYPDPWADEGEHRFTYSLLPHTGDWTEGGVVPEAFALNSPLVAVPAAATNQEPPASAGLVEAGGVALALGGVKRAEDGDGIILRVYEPHGARGNVTLRFTRPIRRSERVNLLEEPVADAPPLQTQVAEDGARLLLVVRPFEVVSLRVVF